VTRIVQKNAGVKKQERKKATCLFEKGRRKKKGIGPLADALSPDEPPQHGHLFQ
jgi:hypothetical protein